MNLYLIISGNLTGFSHFYASAGAKDFYEQSKIDFDFRNYLLFFKGKTESLCCIVYRQDDCGKFGHSGFGFFS